MNESQQDRQHIEKQQTQIIMNSNNENHQLRQFGMKIILKITYVKTPVNFKRKMSDALKQGQLTNRTFHLWIISIIDRSTQKTEKAKASQVAMLAAKQNKIFKNYKCKLKFKIINQQAEIMNFWFFWHFFGLIFVSIEGEFSSILIIRLDAILHSLKLNIFCHLIIRNLLLQQKINTRTKKY